MKYDVDITLTVEADEPEAAWTAVNTQLATALDRQNAIVVLHVGEPVAVTS